MITAKKLLSKPKKSFTANTTTSKKKVVKAGKKVETQGDLDKKRYIEMTPIHERSSDTFRTYKYAPYQYSQDKEETICNPYYELFEKCQRNTQSVQNQIMRQKQKIKKANKKVLKQRKEDRIKNVSLSPLKNNSKDLKDNKKHKTSKSVQMIKNGGKVLHRRLNSQSEDRGVIEKRQDTQVSSRVRRVSTSTSIKKILFGDNNVSKSNKDSKQLTPTLKKNRLKSKSNKALVVPKDKLSNKTYLDRQNKCKSQLNKRVNLKQHFEVSKDTNNNLSKLEFISQNASSERDSDNSLITIEDFDEDKKQSKILKLIEQIEQDVQDQRIQRKLHKLSKITSKYIKTNDNTHTNMNKRDSQTNTTIKHDFKFYDVHDQKQQIQSQGNRQQQQSLQQKQSSIQQRQISNNIYIMQQDSYIPVLTKFSPPFNFQSQYTSPPTSFQQIQKIINQRNILSNTKYQSKLKVFYKLYENNIYSPKTFQNKVLILDQIQDKQLNNHLELSRKIKTLAKQIRQDKQQIQQFQSILNEERWEDADQILKVKQQEMDMKKALKQFIKISPRPVAQPSQNSQLSTSPANKDEQSQKTKVNQIFQQFYNTPQDQIQEQDYHKNQRTKYHCQIAHQQQQYQSNQLDLSQICVIRQFCISIYKHIMQSPKLQKQFVTNLLQPVIYDISDLLFIYHLDINESILNNNPHCSYHYWKRSLPVKQIISEQAIQQIIIHLEYNSQNTNDISFTHQRMIFDALNESLNLELAYLPSIIQKPDPKLCKHIKLSNRLIQYLEGCYESEEQVQNMYIRSVERVISWAKYYSGTLQQTFFQQVRKRKEIGLDTDDIYQNQQSMRKNRMALFLQGFVSIFQTQLIDLQLQIKDVSFAEIEVKLRVQRLIRDNLVLEIAQQILAIQKRVTENHRK